MYDWVTCWSCHLLRPRSWAWPSTSRVTHASLPCGWDGHPLLTTRRCWRYAVHPTHFTFSLSVAPHLADVFAPPPPQASSLELKQEWVRSIRQVIQERRGHLRGALREPIPLPKTPNPTLGRQRSISRRSAPLLSATCYVPRRSRASNLWPPAGFLLAAATLPKHPCRQRHKNAAQIIWLQRLF